MSLDDIHTESAGKGEEARVCHWMRLLQPIAHHIVRRMVTVIIKFPELIIQP